MALCDRCIKVDIHSLRYGGHLFGNTESFFLLGTLQQVFEGAASQCPFCQMLVSSFRTHDGSGIHVAASMHSLLGGLMDAVVGLQLMINNVGLGSELQGLEPATRFLYNGTYVLLSGIRTTYVYGLFSLA